MRRWRPLGLVMAGWLVACGGGGPSAGPVGSSPRVAPDPPPPAPPPAPVDADRYGAFPSLAELRALSRAPTPPRPMRVVPPVVDPVPVIGPLPTRVGLATLRDPDDPFDPILGDAIAGFDAVVSQTVGMNCVARELGHYVATTGREPDEVLRRFAALACGLATTNVATRGQFFTGGARMTPAQAAAKFGDLLPKLAGAPLFPIDHQVGGWLGRAGDRWTVMLAAAPMPLAIDPGDRRARGDSVALTGRIFDEAERLMVQITHGPFGVAQCAVDPEVELPRFAIECPTHRGDPTATISIGAFQRGRLLGRMLGAVQVWPQRAGPARFEPVVDGTRLPDDPGGWGPALLAAINSRREALGLEAVAFDAAQSAGIAPLNGPFDDAVRGAGDVEAADKVAMGVMAGWQVGGHVLEGAFAAGRVGGPKTVERLLAELLWLPDGRRVLFDVRATRLAIGAARLPAADDSKPVGVLVGAYRTLEEGWRFDLARDDADEALAALARARAARGRSAPVRQPVVEQAHVPLSGAELTGAEVTEALAALMTTTGAQFGRQAAGVALRTTHIDGVAFPAPILEVEPLEVAVVVGYGTREAGPWPPRVVLMSYPR